MNWILVAGAVSLASFPALADPCHPYGAVVILSGTFAPAVLAASPSGRDDPREVPGRTSDLLILDMPLCVSANMMSAGVTAALDVQLVCPSLTAASGDEINLTGRLFGAHTGNGHTPVLLSCAW